MPPRQKTPAPIDKPLSRAYLREFTGWSTAYPPGISDPTSLRVMENVMINRDGSARVRPGLRYLSYEDVAGVLEGVQHDVVGTHEPFFLNDGSKAYLFAVREDDGTVGFRVLANDGIGMVVMSLTAAGFTFPVSEANVAFSASTTWVKYLQIDNKVFALSDAGESMRMFTVGADKTAKKLASIEKPDWTNNDKLDVIQPDASWLNGTIPSSVRTNLCKQPDMEVVSKWVANAAYTKVSRSTAFAQEGSYSLRLESLPQRTNFIPHPLHDMPTYGTTGWNAAGEATSLSVSGTYLTANIPGNSDKTKVGWARHEGFDVDGGDINVSFDLEAAMNIAQMSVRVRFLNTSGSIISTSSIDISKTAGRKYLAFDVPAGTTQVSLWVGGTRSGAGTAEFSIKSVLVCPAGQSATFFHGGSGTNYFWTGTTGASASVYHPPSNVVVYYNEDIPVDSSADYNISAYFRSGSTARGVTIPLGVLNASGNYVVSESGSPAVNDASAAWTRIDNTITSPATGKTLQVWFQIAAVPRGEYHYIDSVLFEKASTVQAYFDGSTSDTSTIKHAWTGASHDSTSTKSTYPAADSIPAAETKTVNTLISSTRTSNVYNFGFFYTFNNEIGESAASKVTHVRTQRPWSGWAWETANAAGEPSGTSTSDPANCADQLVAIIPTAVWQAGMDAGATHWNLYVFTWSDQDPVPVQALRVGRRELGPTSTRNGEGWLRVTPDMAGAGDLTAQVPQVNTRFNYSNPSRGGQGLVAGDRMILVLDPTAQNVVKWSSNQIGQYSDFSASRGGGYKTLPYGDLYVPAAVKLWQNPQSVDTITILCLGVDGRSTSYYMAPSTVTSQSEQVQVMGFEETTATPGTTSPYGVEVVNNALYHPVDEMLMKTTANNYNITHKSMTDPIQDGWQRLLHKSRIRSSHHDNRLYYLVHNPQGAPLEPGCLGNEVWVFDLGSEKGNWSRWLVQGHSLRKIDRGSQVVMSVVRPDGIYYFDDTYNMDDYVDDTKTVLNRAIPWFLETNTQGANRAHDAWCNLQQANVSLGFFQGIMEYGVRGLDVNGKMVEVKKKTRDYNDPSDLAFDIDDFLLVRAMLREWFFFAGSVTDEGTGEVLPSSGQISLVQYRYTPISVNVGYEFGSVETFEYGRAGNAVGDRTTDNGVPMPMIDTARP